VKSSKLFIFTSLLALAVVNLASAQSTIRITGSTAFRAATHQAILHIIQPATLNYGYTGTSFNSATEAIITGTTNTTPAVAVIIKTAWSGSVGGVFTLATNGPVPNPGANPPITAGWLVNTTPTSPAGTPNAPLNFDAPVTADIAMSDSFQSSTPFTNPPLVDNVVGVVPFVWVRNAGAPTTLSNVTNQLAKVVLNNPGIPLSLFTGNAADAATLVYATGRNNDSGTRLDAFAESGFGITNAPVQLDCSQAAASGFDFINAGVWTTGVNGPTFYAASGGRSSGGLLVGDMNATNSNAVLGGWIVTYLGIPDSNNVNGGANDLTYNGFPYSVNNVQQGNYSFWSYEHLLYRTSLSGNALTVAQGLATQIHNTDASVAGVLVTSMAVGRTSEGAPITPGNPF
jgi:hypothetical protein